MASEVRVQHTRTFKKYKSEYRSEVLAAARDYVRAHPGFICHEDASILKVTADKETLEAMLTVLRAKFGRLVGDEEPKAPKAAP